MSLDEAGGVVIERVMMSALGVPGTSPLAINELPVTMEPPLLLPSFRLVRRFVLLDATIACSYNLSPEYR